ncbi:phospholipase A [Vibrio rumoiensis]|uniref:Phospholipase A1 n=1 Tax=Vibrio rumoiensis 1S-45 TaxID=1188252 RepID=A0A1E5E3Y6_9VIBR|nr:phospholipase A [Vibrio rumoiensis]OEF26828.1 phospholipase [Vibrio rumoiensis 1S-45]
MKEKTISILLMNVFCSSFAWAETPSAYDLCLLDKIKKQKGNETIDSVRNQCQLDVVTEGSTVQNATDESLAEQRVQLERETAFEPYVITAHRLNYLLPITYSDSINEDAYSDTDWGDGLRNAEAEFQISFKVPLNYGDLMFEGDGLYFGMTLKSFWQVYAQEISRPFRETNYRPELFYITPTSWTPFGGQTAFGFGVEHESNGQRQVLSRSWNRVYGQFHFAKDNFVMTLQPWWRIPEDEKDSPTDPSGDDNPDIEDFMGHFELSSAYRWNDLEFSFLGRENFSTHKGYAEFGMTFPIFGKIRGYAKYSSGYGSSLIDYNQNQQRIGLGIAITELL